MEVPVITYKSNYTSRERAYPFDKCWRVMSSDQVNYDTRPAKFYLYRDGIMRRNIHNAFPKRHSRSLVSKALHLIRHQR